VPEEGQRVVLAEGVELDRPLDHLAEAAVRLASAFGRERLDQLAIAVVAGGDVVQGADEPAGGVARRRGVEVHPEGAEDLGRIAFEFPQLILRDPALEHSKSAWRASSISGSAVAMGFSPRLLRRKSARIAGAGAA
jgi:hypothetical protein